jgi:hypothetical protein
MVYGAAAKLNALDASFGYKIQPRIINEGPEYETRRAEALPTTFRRGSSLL